MRDNVRRLCSPLTASKPSPIATSGTRNDSSATSDSGLLRVNSRRNRNGSSAVSSLICSIAPRTTATAVATISTTSTTTRMLVKWSAISFSVTTPKPCRADPSRRMALSLVGLEVARIDSLEARLLDRQPQQASTSSDHRRGCLRAHVVVRGQTPAASAHRLDLLHAGHGREPLREPLPFCFNLDTEAAAQHLAAELGHRADQGDIA